VPNQALQNSNGRLQAAQAQQAQAQAQKAMAEQAILQQAARSQGLGYPVQAQPQVSPQEVQGMIQAGQLDQSVADRAVDGLGSF
jgi:hypothetical protein